MQETLRGEAPESLRAGVGASGFTRKIDHDAVRGFWINADIGVTDVENRFHHSEFEVDAAVDDLDVGNRGGRAALAFAGGSGALEEGLDVPGAGVGFHQVDAGLHQLQF